MESEDIKPDVNAMDIDGSYAVPNISASSSNVENPDPVVRRIPLYYKHHPSPSRKYVLLQYLDKAKKPGNPNPLIAENVEDERRKLYVMTKPKSRAVQVNVPLDDRRMLWNHERSATYARGQKFANDHPLNGTPDLSYMSLESTKVSDSATYCIGLIKNGACYLTPLEETYQMRPALNYLDNIYSVERKSKTTAAAAKSGNTQDSKDDFKAVQVQIVQSSDSQSGTRSSDLFEIYRAHERESWQPYTHNPSDSIKSQALRDNLTQPSSAQLISKSKAADYLK